MTIAQAVDHLTEELDLDADDIVILTSTLIRIEKNAYNSGWAEGMAEGLEQAEGDFREEW